MKAKHEEEDTLKRLKSRVANFKRNALNGQFGTRTFLRGSQPARPNTGPVMWNTLSGLQN